MTMAAVVVVIVALSWLALDMVAQYGDGASCYCLPVSCPIDSLPSPVKRRYERRITAFTILL